MILLLLTVACSNRGARSSQPGIQPPEVTTTATSRAVKIFLSEPGLYRVSSRDLSNAGLEVSAEQAGQIKITHRGKPVSAWVEKDGREFAIDFYGIGSDSIYARESVYWFEVEASASNEVEIEMTAPRTPEREDMQKFQSTEPDAVIAQLLLDQNILYVPQVESGDHWLWLSLPAPNRTDLEFRLSDVAPGQAGLRLSLWAGTMAPGEPDHHIKLSINGAPVADAYLDGMGARVVDAEFSTEILRDGSNQLTIEAPGDTGVAADVVHLNSVELVFPRHPVALQEVLEFISSGGTIKFQGFRKSYSVYDITDPLQVSRVSESVEPDTPFTGISGKRYLAVGEAGIKSPDRLSLANTSPDLRAPGSGADYVGVGPAPLLQPLAPLMKLRSEQGLKTSLADVQAVYDQFTFGYPEPEAIQKFMRYAMENWVPPPKFLLLVGDASYDPRGYQTPPEANQLPTFLIQTEYGGETASDVGFVQLNDDPWPDLAIGRMPARSVEQVSELVAKTLKYEASMTSRTLEQSIVAIADGQDPSFRDDAQAFLDLFPASYERELYAPDAGVVGANQEIKKILEAGNRVVAYFGHGSVNMWGKDKLFTAVDVGQLSESERFPVVINMTCLTGLYTHPKLESLAEALLWKKEGGAVAVLAPSSLTLPIDQSFLSRALVDAMLADPQARLGEIHLRARRQVPAVTSGSLDVMRTFMLFGDPALRMGQ